MAKDLANTLAAAKLVSLSTKPKIIKNSIGKRDRSDVIQLNLTTASILDIRASKLAGRANIALLNSAGQVIGRFRRSRRNQIFNETVDAGIYYVQITTKNRKSTANYALRMSATVETVSWYISPPGSNQIPENIVLPGSEISFSGTVPSRSGNPQTFFLSELVDPGTLAQILDSDGSNRSRDSSNFPFTRFSLNSSRRLSKVEIEKIGTNINGSLNIQDYKITLFASNDGRGDSSSGAIRLPDAEFSSNDDLNITDLTIVLLDGTPYQGSVKSEWIYGSNSNDTISGSDGDDYILGGEGSDSLNGGNGDDYLNGGAGNDVLDGGLTDSNNTMRGGIGDDYYFVRDSGDNVYEQQSGGTDTVEAFVSFGLDGSDALGSARYIEFLRLAESGGAINGRGSDATNTLIGNSSNNILDGQSGDDFLFGGDGNDLLIGRSGIDTLVGGNGFDAFAFNSPFEDLDIIKDFQVGFDFIQIYRSTSSDFGLVDLRNIFYDQRTGNLSFATPAQSTIFAQLETRPAPDQLARSIFFSPERARFEI